MNFIEAVRNVLTKYAHFNGRARRSEYWWFFLFNIILSILANVIDVITNPNGAGMVDTIVTIGLLIPGIAVAVRRMHDVGKSGWYVLIPIYNLVLTCTAGDMGTNKYGTDPKVHPLEEDINAIGKN
ncbi:MAG: DUF805 domain-containing protein [Sphingobacteriales bacterium]